MLQFKKVSYLPFICLLFVSMSYSDELLTETIDAIRARLELMESVVLYKLENKLPIENVKQDQIALRRVEKKAAQLGLNVNATVAFFKTQLFVANAIQYRYKKALLDEIVSQSGTVLAYQKIREFESVAEEKILVSLSNKLKSGHHFNDENYQQFMSDLKLKNVVQRDKMIMFEALKNVKLK